MASRTLNDLVVRTLQRVGILAAGSAPSNEDAQLVRDVYASVRLELAQSGIGGLQANSIPVDAFEALADYLAKLCAIDFGLEADPAAIARAKGRLNAAAGTPYTGSYVSGDDY